MFSQVVIRHQNTLRLTERLGKKIAEKRKEVYASVINNITKLRFALLRKTLAAVQGFRSKSDACLQDLMDIDFSLIPTPITL